MSYELVIKFWRKSLDDEAFLPAIQDELKTLLGEGATLDGYDVGAKEINLFVLTADPRVAFRRINQVLEREGVVRGVSAGYRLVGGAQFTSIWPARPSRKFRLS